MNRERIEQEKVSTNPALSVSPDTRSQVPDPEIAISVQNLTKVYKLYDTPLDRLKESVNPFGKKYHKDFYALNDVSFEIKKGETVGIIGKNGSGKSTLLKIITGVLTQTSGNVTVNGKISALLELGAGFNPELTGIENVYFNGTLMGYTKDEMDARLDDILSFADIGEFVYQPVKSYSSGMFVRLAFAVAINVDPEILIVDEALSVGDVFFQQKCYAEIRKKINSGITCLFVSHDTSAIMNICRHAVLLNKGTIEFRGTPEEVVSRYSASVGSKAKSSKLYTSTKPAPKSADGGQLMASADILARNILPYGSKRHGAGGIVIAAARVTDTHGRDTLHVPMMGNLYFYLLLRANDEVYDPSTGIQVCDRMGNIVFSAGTRQLGQKLPDLKPGQELVVRIELTFSVQPGEYTFSLGTAEPSSEGPNVGYIHDRLDMLGPIVVSASFDGILPFHGIAQLPMEINYSKQ